MQRTYRRLVLRPPAGEAEVRAFAGSAGWELRREHREDRARLVPHELVFAAPGGETWINYVDDYIVGFPYLAVSGREPEAAIRQLRSALPVIPEEEIVAEATSADSADPARAVRRLGVVAPPEFDARYFDAFARAFGHPDPEVRIAAVWASSYPGWSQLKPLLERLRREDPSRKVRREADNMYGAFADQGV